MIADLQKKFNISQATVRNWIKTGFINIRDYSSESEYQEILKEATNQVNYSPRLKKRANRTQLNHQKVYYLGITDPKLRRIIEQAVGLHRESGLPVETGLFYFCEHYLTELGLIGNQYRTGPQSRLENWFAGWFESLSPDVRDNPFKALVVERSGEDIPGAFYQSIRMAASQSVSGSYYTPGFLLEDIRIQSDWSVLDPCAGSGGILIKILDRNHDPARIYVQDIDPLALRLCVVNLSVFFNRTDLPFHTEHNDFIFNCRNGGRRLKKEGHDEEQYDLVITNPPWGGRYTPEKKAELCHLYPELKSTESASIALLNGMELLKPEGRLIFFLPVSLLNVAAHKNIRKLIAGKRRKIHIRLLGNPFEGVMSEAFLFMLENSSTSESLRVSGIQTDDSEIPYDTLHPPYYIIPHKSDNRDQKLIEKIRSVSKETIQGRAVFGLGIVTGNNHRFITRKPSGQSEPVWRGNQIVPFGFKESGEFIHLENVSFQQTAPFHRYRERKICYRFISGSLVMAVDEEKRLILNSANFFIPEPDLPMECIVALFNSRLYNYLFQKMFHSKKVLRSHLEALPLPEFNQQTVEKLKNLYNRMIMNTGSMKELNDTVYSLFNLTHEESDIIDSSPLIILPVI